MLIRTSILLQSLMVGLFPSGQDRSSSSSESREDSLEQMTNYVEGGHKAQASLRENSREVEDNDVMGGDHWWSPKQLTPIPDPMDFPKMARFVVHNANWTSVAYISHQKGTEGRALADMFSVSDGAVTAGSGIPYFYVSRLEAAVTDLLDNNNQCSLTMGLAQTGLCAERAWDDEDPRCAHVVLIGTFQPVDTTSDEFKVAQDALFARHPSFRTLPPGHHFFVAKYVIEAIALQDDFGGPVPVPVNEYYQVHDRAMGLISRTTSRFNYFVSNV